jgi:Trypsin-like peptidase domain
MGMDASNQSISAEDVTALVFRVRTAENSGSCFEAGTSRHFLTAKHVVCKGNEPRGDVEIFVGEEWVPASVTPLSSQDIAVLRIERPIGLRPFPLREVICPERGMKVGVYGLPSNEELGPWQTANVDGPLGDGTWQLGFATALPEHLRGASGGPVLNEKNEIVGVFVSHSPLVPQHAAFTPLSAFLHLLDFSDPPRNALRCCLLISEAGWDKPFKLRSAVEAGLNIAAKRLRREPRLEMLYVNDCILSRAKYFDTVRQLCLAEVVIFDLTSYEPAMLLFLGIRSAVRAGVTIASLGVPLTVSELGKAPFNIKELNLMSHSEEWLTADPPLYRILSWRITNGIGDLAMRGGYQDSVCFAAVRRLPSGERTAVPASEGALVLCSYADEYSRNWSEIRKALASHLEQRWPEPPPIVLRAVDLNYRSGRLISETMYGAMRRTELCVADWTRWPANVLFEVGVRLAIHPLAAQCIIESAGPAETKQQELLLNLFQPTRYDLESADAVFQQIVARHLLLQGEAGVAVDGTYAITSEFADISGDITATPVYRELLDAAKLMRSDQSAGISAVLYPSNPKLIKQTELATIQRLMAAWDFINDNLADRLDDPEVSESYLEICDILAPLLRGSNPEKAKEIYRSGQKLRSAK